MRPVSIEDFIRIIHADDSRPPSPATVRRQCGQLDELGRPMIPGAYKMGRPWKIDLDAYMAEMRRRINGERDVADEDEGAFLDEIAIRLAS